MASTSFDYDGDYYNKLSASSRQSATKILPLIFRLVQPRNVLDVGCGTGSWLAVARTLGLDDVFGIDGEWVIDVGLQIPRGCFRPSRIEQGFDLEREFDLVMCVEVAEHLSPEFSMSLIDLLVQHAPIVLFSAAIPGQHGEGHVNEAWASFWCDGFAARKYTCFDPIRWQLWDDSDVDVWYRQNARLFVSEQALDANKKLRDSLSSYPAMMDDAVHPEMFKERCQELYARIDELSRWGIALQKRVESYESFPAIDFALRLRRLLRKALVKRGPR